MRQEELTEFTPNCTLLSVTPNPLKKLTTSMVVAPYGRPLSFTFDVVPPLPAPALAASILCRFNQVNTCRWSARTLAARSPHLYFCAFRLNLWRRRQRPPRRRLVLSTAPPFWLRVVYRRLGHRRRGSRNLHNQPQSHIPACTSYPSLGSCLPAGVLRPCRPLRMRTWPPQAASWALALLPAAAAAVSRPLLLALVLA